MVTPPKIGRRSGLTELPKGKKSGTTGRLGQKGEREVTNDKGEGRIPNPKKNVKEKGRRKNFHFERWPFTLRNNRQI